MPTLRFQDDGSISAALSQLAAGVNSINDPAKALQAAYLNAHMQQAQASTVKTNLEATQLGNQISSQDEAGRAAGDLIQLQNPRPVIDLPQGAQGPQMPPEMADRARAIWDAKMKLARSGALNAYRRGGGPLDALKIGPAAVAQGDVMFNGAPTDEQTARTDQAMLSGSIPSADTPLTLGGRQAIINQDVAKQNAVEDYKQGVTPLKVGPTEGVYFPTKIGPKFGVQPGPDGTTQIAPRVPVTPTNDMQNYERYAVQEREAGRAPLSFYDYQTGLKRSGAQTQEGSYAAGLGTGMSKEILDAAKASSMAADHSVTLDQIGQLLDNVDTGKTTALMEALRQRTGISLDPNTDKVQQLNALVSRMIPQMRPAGSGSTSDFEEKLYAQSLMGLANTPGGNRLILDSLRRANALALARGQIAREAMAGRMDGPTAMDKLGGLHNQWVQELGRFGITPDQISSAAATAAPAQTGGGGPAPRRVRVNPQTGAIEEVP
jgi:hypothetical protein